MKIVQATGQTCNQFWIYSNFLAEAIEKKEKFAIWVPDISFENYPFLLDSEFISYPLYSKRLARVFGYKNYVKALKVIFFNKFSIVLFEKIINAIPSKSFIIANTSVNKSIYKRKHLEQLLGHYIPSESIVSKVDDFIYGIRKEYEIIIGVHIRYGDYRTWNNGKYFYTLTQYAGVLKNVQKIFDNRKIAFCIASNEIVDTTFFMDYKCFSMHNSSMAEDNYMLSKTDYILGPPSTFSAWASLYNNIPYYSMETAKTDFKYSNFIDVKETWF